MNSPRRALLAVEAPIERDPRVRRQVEWLAEAGWTVDTLGSGPGTSELTDTHYELGFAPAWTGRRAGTLIAYGLRSRQSTFKLLTQSRFPAALQAKVQDGDYDLIVLNDRHFAPWVNDLRKAGSGLPDTKIHVDLHEYFPQKVVGARSTLLWRLVTGRQYAWARRQIGSPHVNTRSTVNSAIAKLYAQELNVPEPTVVTSGPPFTDLQPSDVDPRNIRLVHHGKAHWNRGLREMIDAMRLMDNRFSLTLMLLGFESIIDEVREYASDLGDRVQVVPPVPMPEISEAINEFDLEIMFFPPVTRNLELALPNKLFEAVQGRLGLVVGRSPMMEEVIIERGNGIVVDGWKASDLASAMNAITAETVSQLKMASHLAAPDLSAEKAKLRFLTAVECNDSPRVS